MDLSEGARPGLVPDVQILINEQSSPIGLKALNVTKDLNQQDVNPSLKGTKLNMNLSYRPSIPVPDVFRTDEHQRDQYNVSKSQIKEDGLMATPVSKNRP